MNSDAEIVGNLPQSAVCFVLSHDDDSGACLLQVPSDVKVRFEEIGRDGDSCILRTETGGIVKIELDDQYALQDLDELLRRPVIQYQQMDSSGLVAEEYGISSMETVEETNKVGFNA